MIKNCRACNSKKLNKLISLKKIHFSGKFPKKKQKIKKGLLELIICSRCKLTQLSNNFPLKYMYDINYGYRSGINETMKNHLKEITKKISKLIKLKNGDLVLDIASNDATLLNSYKNRNILKFGIDPTIKKYRKYYKNINYKISDFFNSKKYFLKTKHKAKVITCISMFYDLKNPNIFLKDVKKILTDDGIFILEQSDLSKMVSANAFDTICHEHLEYYSIRSLNFLLKKNGFKIFDHEYNSTNGGSSRFYVTHESNIKYKKSNKINNLIKIENLKGINNGSSIKQMMKRVDKIGIELNKLLNKIKSQKKIIHGYGASTKGNVLLQYYKISNFIKYIADRNSLKVGLYTPDNKIKIISEIMSRKLNPDYYFVLPWHFKENIIRREKKIFKNKSKFIFPLPNIKII